MIEKLKELLEEQKKAFEKFKKANDDRLAAIEMNGGSDALLEEKVEKANEHIATLEKQINDLTVKLNRPGGTGDDTPGEVAEHKKAFGDFLRKGRDEGLRELEIKALNVTVDEDGGFAVPTELDRNILQLMRNESPMRRVCTVIQMGGAEYKKLVNVGGATSGWVDEDDSRSETNTPQLKAMTPFMGEIYANPAATQTMLDDSFFSAEQWLQDEVSFAFATAEGSAFLSGNGVKKPKGILAYSSAATADASRSFGVLQHIAAASATALTGDELLDMIYALKKGYRQGAIWMCNSLTVKAIRKLKDSYGQYLWAPGLVAGQPSMLLGYPTEENEDMADIAASAITVMFGNFKRAYKIIDRMGVRVLRDPYTNKPYVHFYTTKRVGGYLEDSNAVKLLVQHA